MLLPKYKKVGQIRIGIVLFLVCVFYSSETNGRHISLQERIRGERIHGDSVTVEALDASHEQRQKLKTLYVNSLRLKAKKALEDQQSGNQYYKVLRTHHEASDEFLSSIKKKAKLPRVHKEHEEGSGSRGSSSSFRHNLHFFGDEIPVYDDNYTDDDEESDARLANSPVDDSDPHFYHERYKSAGNKEINIKDDEEDSQSDETDGKHSLVNSYFDNEYSLNMLHSMECITPTKSKGYCSTFKACVPSLFNSKGELEAPALAELVSMSIGYCTSDLSATSANDFMKRVGPRYEQVSTRIICCPGSPPAPGTNLNDASAEKFNDFLAGSNPAFEEDGDESPASIKNAAKKKPPMKTSPTLINSIKLNSDGTFVDTEAEVWHSEEDQKIPKKPSHIIPIEAFIPPGKLHAYDPHTNTFSGQQSLTNSQSPGNHPSNAVNEPAVQIQAEDNISNEQENPEVEVSDEETETEEVEKIVGVPSGISGGMSDEYISNQNPVVVQEATAETDKGIQTSSDDVKVEEDEKETATTEKAQENGENSTFIEISPKPILGANGKFTLEKGVIVEKPAASTPRPKPNPAHQTQIGETTVNIIKAETTVDSKPILLINPNTKLKNSSTTGNAPQDEIKIVQLPIFSSKIPQIQSDDKYEIVNQEINHDSQADFAETTTHIFYNGDKEIQYNSQEDVQTTFDPVHADEAAVPTTTIRIVDDTVGSESSEKLSTISNANIENNEFHQNDEQHDETEPIPTTTTRCAEKTTVSSSDKEAEATTTFNHVLEISMNDEETGDEVEIPTTTRPQEYFHNDNQEHEEIPFNDLSVTTQQPSNTEQNDEEPGAGVTTFSTTFSSSVVVNKQSAEDLTETTNNPVSIYNMENEQKQPEEEVVVNDAPATAVVSETVKIKDPVSYETQSFDDSAEFRPQVFKISKPKPTSQTQQLFLDAAARPSMAPPQIHEDDSLENEHFSPDTISPTGWSIDKLYEQHNELSANKIANSNSQQKVKNGQKPQASSAESSAEPNSSESYHDRPTQSGSVIAPGFIGSQESYNIQVNPSGNNKQNDKLVFEPSAPITTEFKQNQEKPGPSSSESTEVGGMGAHQPNYNVLAACASQDYYRSLEQDSSKQYPHLVTIVGGSRPFCSGSLITDRHVLTAAHFLANITVSDVFHMRIHAGYKTGFNGETEGPFAVRKVLKVIRHKGFSFDKLLNDMAILLLDRPIRFTEDVHPVCLNNDPIPQATEAYETGWVEDPLMKKISPHHPFVDPHILKYFTFGYKNVTWALQESVTRVKSKEDCQSDYAFLEKSGISITDSMVCAATDDGKSCGFKGNSGSPLFINKDGKQVQIGLVSWGIGCGHFASVFTSTSNFIPWIQKVVDRTS